MLCMRRPLSERAPPSEYLLHGLAICWLPTFSATCSTSKSGWTSHHEAWRSIAEKLIVETCSGAPCIWQKIAAKAGRIKSIHQAATLASTTILHVSMNVLLKYFKAAAASSADLKPMKPNCLEAPSLHSFTEPMSYGGTLDISLWRAKYLDLTTLASVTSPFAEKCSRNLSSLTYLGSPFTHNLLVI